MSDMDRSIRFTVYFAIAFLAALTVLVLLPSATAEPIELYENNEEAADAIWLDTPVSLQGVWIWKSENGTTNRDYWKFNASAGQYIELKFRKYTRYQNPELPFRGGTYYIKYEVWDTAYRPIHQYHLTYRENGGYRYRRDSWSFQVPENLGGRFFIHVWVDPPGNEDRNYAYYFLNVTVDDKPSLKVGSGYASVMEMSDEFFVDYNFIDYYTVTLTKGQLMAINLSKEHNDHPFYLDVWETIPFGAASQQTHMLNRTQAVAAATIQVRFEATHDGTYLVRVWRSTNVESGTTSTSGYDITWSFGTATLDADDEPTGGMEIVKATDVRRQSLEMGLDVHDWYQVKVLAGDKLLRVTVDFNDPDIGDGHAFELVIYNETGFVMWADTSRDPGPTFASTLELPPVSTITIFDQDETFYVRISVNTVDCGWGFRGFSTNYNVDFKLSNRAPSLIEPFEDVYEWDEDETISIELDSHFTDPDEDSMFYTVFNKTQGFTYDIPGLAYHGYLNITPPPDWNGEVWWRLRAVDSGQTAEHHYIYIDLHLVVRPVSDLPRSNGTISVACDEETFATWDLTKTFYDADAGPQGVLTFGWIDVGEDDIEVILDTETGVTQLVPAVDVTGKYEFTVFCFDNTMEQVTETLTLTVRPVNDVPRITEPIPTVDMDEGDDPIELDLSLYFHDVDGGDALLYTWTIPNEFSAGINVYHKNNVATESNIVIELLYHNFYAYVVINITCKDPDDTWVMQDLIIDIANVPNAPVISVTPDGAASDIDEMQSLLFSVADLTDADELEFGLHNFTWYLDEVIVLQEVGSLSSYTYRSDYDSTGPHTVHLVVRDPTGLGPAKDPVWTFHVRDVNRAPTVTITTQATAMDEDDKLTLTVDWNDPDGDDVEITWYLITKDEDKLLGTGSPLEVKLPAGTQKIDVEVDDLKGGKDTATFSQKVSAVEEESGMGMWLGLIVLVVVIAIIAFMLVRMRGGKPAAQPETSIDLESLQKGYDPTQGRDGDAGSEYEEYNPTPQSNESYEELQR